MYSNSVYTVIVICVITRVMAAENSCRSLQYARNPRLMTIPARGASSADPTCIAARTNKIIKKFIGKSSFRGIVFFYFFFNFRNNVNTRQNVPFQTVGKTAHSNEK